MPLPRVWNILLHTVPFCKPPECFGLRACCCAKVCWCILDTIVPSFYAVLLASLPCPVPVHISAPLLLLPSSAREKNLPLLPIANCPNMWPTSVLSVSRTRWCVPSYYVTSCSAYHRDGFNLTPPLVTCPLSIWLFLSQSCLLTIVKGERYHIWPLATTWRASHWMSNKLWTSYCHIPLC